MTMHLLVSLFGLLALSAYCSAGEAAWRSIARSPISPHAGRLRLLAADLDRDPRQMLAAVFLVKHATNVAAVAVATLAAWELSPRHGLALSILGMTAGLLLVSEVLPARFAAHHRLATARVTLPLLWLARLLRPLSGLLHRLPAAGEPASGDSVTEAELLTMVAAVHGGDIKEREKQLIHNIFEFDDTSASEIMTPRADMFVVDIHTKPDLTEIFKSGFTRIPVIDGDMDHIIGILNIKDLLLRSSGDPETINLRQIMREPYFVPEHKKLDKLLQGFKRRKQHMAVVVDEHGGVSGLITLEDALEEIVGEITDETDVIEPTIVAVAPGEWRVMGKTEIGEVNEKLKMDIPDTGEYDTFSGYVMSQTGRIPREAEEIPLGEFTAVVMNREGNRILEYKVRKRAAAAASNA